MQPGPPAPTLHLCPGRALSSPLAGEDGRRSRPDEGFGAKRRNSVRQSAPGTAPSFEGLWRRQPLIRRLRRHLLPQGEKGLPMSDVNPHGSAPSRCVNIVGRPPDAPGPEAKRLTCRFSLALVKTQSRACRATGQGVAAKQGSRGGQTTFAGGLEKRVHQIAGVGGRRQLRRKRSLFIGQIEQTCGSG
jgi:hypothetical protein